MVEKKRKLAVQRQVNKKPSRSHLLRMPAELRNHIYELVARDSRTVCLRDEILLYTPPLSLTCTQIREEFRTIFIEEAILHASTLRTYITNFKLPPSSIPDRQTLHYRFVKSLRPEADTISATVGHPPWHHTTIVINLTNTFDSYFPEMRNILNVARKQDFSYEISADSKSFDFEYCRQTLPRILTRFQNPKAVDLLVVVEEMLQAAEAIRRSPWKRKKATMVRGGKKQRRA